MYLSASIRRQRMRLAPGRGLYTLKRMRQAKTFVFFFFFFPYLFGCGALSCSGAGLMMPPPLLTINNLALILYLHARTLHTFTETSECSFFSPLSFLIIFFYLFFFFFAAVPSHPGEGNSNNKKYGRLLLTARKYSGCSLF